MVQRKVPAKLLLQPQSHHDLKYNNKRPDLKKKMMKTINRPPSPVAKTPTRPNYMKSTTSSDARKEQSQSPVSSRKRSLDSLREGESCGKRDAKKVLGRSFLSKSPSSKASPGSAARRCSTLGLCDAERATCSSTLKDCKFPAYLSLNQGGTQSEGTSSVKVCPYTYCSLNGHHHAPLPPLKCFLSARRIDKPVAVAEEKDFFVEIYSKGNEDAGSGEEWLLGTLSETPLLVEEERDVGLLNQVPADVDLDQIDYSEASDMGYQSSLHLDYDYEYTPAIDVEPDPEPGAKNSIINDDLIIYSDCSFDEVSQESYEESMSSDAFSSSDDGESSLPQSAGVDDDDKHILSETLFNNPSDESLAIVSHLVNFDEDIITSGEEAHSGGGLQNSIQDDLRPETDEIALARVTAKSKKQVIQESDDPGCFNPRGPNFLPLEPEADGEKVDLRHQDLDERKNSEEWMVDYALRQVVTKLAPARKKKVALLVEAFEKVMPTSKLDHQLIHSCAFDQSRTMQACI